MHFYIYFFVWCDESKNEKYCFIANEKQIEMQYATSFKI